MQNAQLNLKFRQTTNNLFSIICCMQYLGHTYTKNLSIVYPKFNFNCTSVFHLTILLRGDICCWLPIIYSHFISKYNPNFLENTFLHFQPCRVSGGVSALNLCWAMKCNEQRNAKFWREKLFFILLGMRKLETKESMTAALNQVLPYPHFEMPEKRGRRERWWQG